MLPVNFGSILVAFTVLSVQCGLSSDHTRGASLPFSITISSSSSPPALSLCTVRQHPIPLFWWTMGMVVAMSPFFHPSSSYIIGLLLRGAGRVVVPVSLAPLPSPLFRLCAVIVVISVAAVMGVVPPSTAVASLLALPVPVSVAVVLPGVRVEVVSRPVLPGRVPGFLLSSFGSPAGFVAVSVFHHERPVQVSLHVGVQVEGGGHPKALLGVELVKQGLAARP